MGSCLSSSSYYRPSGVDLLFENGKVALDSWVESCTIESVAVLLLNGVTTVSYLRSSQVLGSVKTGVR